ncbi:RimK family protein [Kiritimatiellota bacterium B12222]|nr:RimK family protein [Kiritimatiellota bacterium B12222]
MTIRNLIIVDHPRHWSFEDLPAEVISARDYLSSDFPETKGSVRVFNLCNSYRYQSLGYYVSLLAEARGQVPRPGVATIRDVRMLMVARSFAEEIEDCIKQAFKDRKEQEITFRVFCGKSPSAGVSKLARDLYRLFPAPMMEYSFAIKDQRWQLSSIRPLNIKHLMDAERSLLQSSLREVILKRERHSSPGKKYSYDLAMVVDPKEAHPPSNEKALQLFEEAARSTGFYVERIQTGDIGRINEFDAVFIRQTTAVDKAIFRLARMAHAEGLIVVDDPWSILKSANKIFLAESLERAGLPAPGTWVLTKRDLKAHGLAHISFPCVLKEPDGAFSLGVHKCVDEAAALIKLKEMLKSSDLIIAQEFLPSDYDWRIGVLGNEPIFACKYYMAEGHWQIYNWAADEKNDQEGNADTVPLYQVPPLVIETALKASKIMGDGLYGVDLKQIGERVVVIEVNDNPNIDFGVEDAVDGPELYLKLARYFRKRIEDARN